MTPSEWWAANPLSPEVVADLAVRQTKLAERMLEDDPDLPMVSAVVMAGDALSTETADKMVEAGVPIMDAARYVGSFARLKWVVGAMAPMGLGPLLASQTLAALWRDSDPDDTDPVFLGLWRKAWEREGRRTILDRDPLPRPTLGGSGGRKYHRIWRGESARAKAPGIAWTLDRSVAEAFALGRGVRAPIAHPRLVEARVHHREVLAYLTQRGESEVIVDPRSLR